jgi:hypothetical protein
VASIIRVEPRNDGNMTDSGRDRLVAAGAAIRLECLERLNPANLDRPTWFIVDDVGAEAQRRSKLELGCLDLLYPANAHATNTTQITIAAATTA